MICPIPPRNKLFFYGKNVRCFLHLIFFVGGRGKGGRSDRKLSGLGMSMLNHPWKCCFIQKFAFYPRFFYQPRCIYLQYFLLKKKHLIFKSTITSRHVASGWGGVGWGQIPLSSLFLAANIFLKYTYQKLN